MVFINGLNVKMDCEVKLEVFEGPLDLLLHLIYKNEVDIFDIPIATITDQYLEYLDMMKVLNMEIASDFLLMASTLVHIKSKMLLPESIDGDEEEDPRIEITRPLLEYMRFRDIAEELSEREILNRDVFARSIPPYVRDQIEDQESELDVNLFQLMDAFKHIMNQRSAGVQLRFSIEKWSVKDKAKVVMAILREKGSMFFGELFGQEKTVSELIVTFLALLELIHIGLVKVFQPTHESDIRLVPCFDDNGSASDRLNNA